MNAYETNTTASRHGSVALRLRHLQYLATCQIQCPVVVRLLITQNCWF